MFYAKRNIILNNKRSTIFINIYAQVQLILYKKESCKKQWKRMLIMILEHVKDWNFEENDCLKNVYGSVLFPSLDLGNLIAKSVASKLCEFSESRKS